MERRRTQRKYKSNLKPLTGWPDMTPFLDVFFLLLIFLTLSTPFVQVSGLEVKLPSVASAELRTGLERFVITITANGGKNQLYFNDKPLALEQLAEELSEVSRRSGMNMVIVRADAATPHATVAEVMSIAARFGLSTFLATGVPDKAETNAGGVFVRPGE